MLLKLNFIGFNHQNSMQTLSSESIKYVDSFTYLESEIDYTEKDGKICISKAWDALNRM